MIVIKCKSGLCNRLRVLFSYYNWAQNTNQKVIFIWKKNEACNGEFLDYFMPVPNVKFEKKRNRNKVYKYNNVGSRWHPKYSPYETFIYQKLKLRDSMEKEVNKIKLQLGDYIAVHIRRTDHIKLTEKYNVNMTTDGEFCQFIDKYPEKNLYIATDNKDTQIQFYRKYKPRIKVIKFISNNSDLRKTSLRDAIIDMYVCIGAANFKGSTFSSFSDFIVHMRQN